MEESRTSSARAHQLQYALPAHASDIKSVCSAVIDEHEVIFSVGRDGKGVAYVKVAKYGWQKSLVFDAGPRFANSVCFVPRSDAEGHGDSLLIGSLDGLIRVYSLPTSFVSAITATPETLEPTQIIQEHHNNVTSLRYSVTNSLLISGSWDTTARSFKRDGKGKWKLVHILKGQESAVWGVEVVDDRPGQEKYLTASADLFIRLFEQEEMKVVWAGHADVVRTLRLLPIEDEAQAEQLFVSTSNDPKLLINSLSPHRRPAGIPTNGGDPVRTLTGHTSIVYDAVLGPELTTQLVTASEDGTARIWNWTIETSPLVETIWHPKTVGSVWCVTVLPSSGDIVTGGSDGVLRVFSKSAATGDHVATGGHSTSVIGPLAPSDIDDFEKGAQDAAESASHSQVVLSSSQQVAAADQPTAHLTLDPSDQPPAKQAHPLTGVLYDALLPIDVSDDAEPLLLGLNKGDDPLDVTKRFIDDNNLPQTYHDEIVAFINMVGPK